MISFSWIFEFIWCPIRIQIHKICGRSHIGWLTLILLLRLGNIILIQLKIRISRLGHMFRWTIFQLNKIDAFCHLIRTFLNQSNYSILLIDSTFFSCTVCIFTFRWNWWPVFILYNFDGLLQWLTNFFGDHMTMRIFLNRCKTWRGFCISNAILKLVYLIYASVGNLITEVYLSHWSWILLS